MSKSPSYILNSFLTAIGLMVFFGPSSVLAKTDEKAAQAGQILKRYCFRCHSGDGADSGYAFDVRQVATLSEQDVILPGNSKESTLYRLLSSGKMPPRNQPHLPKPSADEAEIVRQWIDAGAPEIPTLKRRDFVSLQETLTSMHKHSSSLAAEDRRNVRYFTLTNLWNDSEIDDAHLRNARAALSKVLNSLSWSPAIVLPQIVDSKGIVLAVDISRLGWTKEHWNSLLDDYPYGVDYGSHPNAELKRINSDLNKLALNSQLLHLRADWLISTAVKPRLYHKLLYELVLPDLIKRPVDPKSPSNPKNMTDRDLEKYLQVNVSANQFANPPRVLRAAFVKSGISGQNRMIEMHRLGSGRVYWKSYDFLASNRAAILAEFPLGPSNPANLFDQLAFKHDGGEIIFTLPNGLQGYLLATGAGARLDAGPIEIVGDSLRTSGNQTIVNGLSCIACHRNGMVEPPRDEIREFASVFGDAKIQVEKLYPIHDVMRDEIDKISKAFTKKLEESMAVFVRYDGGPEPNFAYMPEPVAEVSRRFLLEDMNIETVACELDESNPEQLLVLLKRTQEIRGLGINVLSRENGVIKRDAWESKSYHSLMQETARVLGFTPFARSATN